MKKWGTMLLTLVWWWDRVVDRVLNIGKRNGSYELLPRSDGICGVEHISEKEEDSRRKVKLYVVLFDGALMYP